MLAKSRVIDHYRVKGREKVPFSEPLLEGSSTILGGSAAPPIGQGGCYGRVHR